MQGLSLSPSTTRRADDLRDVIVKAFSSRSHPGDGRIALADARYADYEGHRVGALFRGKDWREVTAPWLRSDYDGDATAVLRFLTDEGFLYYLPAFLTIALDPAAGDVADAVSYALTPPPGEAAGDLAKFRARMRRLSAAERAAVTAVLQHVAEGEGAGGPAHEALQGFWTSAPV